MPLEWKSDGNCYRSSYFGTLRLGPNATSAQIVQQARKLCQELKAKVELRLGDATIDEHMVNEAASKLRDPIVRAEEMLLAHAPALRGKSRLSGLLLKLDSLAEVTRDRPVLELANSLAILWFLPCPGPESIALPLWEELGMGEAGDAEDRALDVVLDH